MKFQYISKKQNQNNNVCTIATWPWTYDPLASNSWAYPAGMSNSYQMSAVPAPQLIIIQ